MRNFKKKAICFMLIGVLLGVPSLSIKTFAQEDNTFNDLRNTDITSNESGVIMSIDDFNNMYCQPETNKSLKSKKTTNPIEININDIVVSNDKVSYNATILYNNTEVPLNAEGKLYNGYKIEQNVNSIVADMNDSSGNFEVLLFEIFNDTSDSNLLVNTSLNNSPHMKIYLLDKDNKLILIETEIPEELIDLKGDNLSRCDSSKDLYWFFNIAKPTFNGDMSTEKILANSEMKIEPYGLDYDDIWIPNSGYNMIFNIGSEEYRIYSVPLVQYKHINVSSDSTWSATFRVAESVSVNFVHIKEHTNPFRYRNIQLSFASGAKSRFLRTYQAGRMIQLDTLGNPLKVAGDKITSKLYKYVVKNVPLGAEFDTIVQFIKNMPGSNTEVKLGTENIQLHTSIVTAVGSKLEKYELYRESYTTAEQEVGHYYSIQSVLQYDSTTKTPVDTVGALNVKFDVFNASDYSTQPINHSFPLYYTASPSKIN